MTKRRKHSLTRNTTKCCWQDSFWELESQALYGDDSTEAGDSRRGQTQNDVHNSTLMCSVTLNSSFTSSQHHAHRQHSTYLNLKNNVSDRLRPALRSFQRECLSAPQTDLLLPACCTQPCKAMMEGRSRGPPLRSSAMGLQAMGLSPSAPMGHELRVDHHSGPGALRGPATLSELFDLSARWLTVR